MKDDGSKAESTEAVVVFNAGLVVVKEGVVEELNVGVVVEKVVVFNAEVVVVKEWVVEELNVGDVVEKDKVVVVLNVGVVFQIDVVVFC